MSYTKNALQRQSELRALHEFIDTARRDLRADRLQRIERLSWEIKSATNDLLAELQALEAERASEAAARADEAINAGHNPF